MLLYPSMCESRVPSVTSRTPGKISVPSVGPYVLAAAGVERATSGAAAAMAPRASADLRFIAFIEILLPYVRVLANDLLRRLDGRSVKTKCRWPQGDPLIDAGLGRGERLALPATGDQRGGAERAWGRRLGLISPIQGTGNFGER